MNSTTQSYITRDEPFGPIDSTDIDPRDAESLEKLFEQHNWIYKNMRYRPSIIMGRKGSGKTSYLRTVYFNKSYDHVTEIRTDHALTHISKVIQGTTKGALFTETLAELWKIIFWMCMLCEIQDSPILPEDIKTRVKEYLKRVNMLNLRSADEVLWKLAGIFDEFVESNQQGGLSEILRLFDHVVFNGTVQAVEDNLKDANKKVVILMDSLDDFQLDIPSVSDSLKGLLKFVGAMNKPRDVVDVRLCLPTELYHRVMDVSSNPNKDFRRSINLQWTATELVLIGAQRLKLYLERYYPDYLQRLLPLDIGVRADALRLFHAVFPKTIQNQSGFQEETISYILRHTQLLPRHFLIFLNSIFKSEKYAQGSYPFPLKEAKILAGVRDVESRIVKEIFVAFKLNYPTAEDVCRKSIPELAHTFSVGELHKVYTRHGKSVFQGDNLFEFHRMLMEIGAIGKVMQGKATEMYIQGNFEYTVGREIPVNHDDEMCLHPLFSGVYGTDYSERPVYPYGTGIDDKDYRDNID